MFVVVEQRDEPRLVQEQSRTTSRVAGALRVQDLDRDVARSSSRRLPRQVDVGHAALREQADQLVATQATVPSALIIAILRARARESVPRRIAASHGTPCLHAATGFG